MRWLGGIFNSKDTSLNKLVDSEGLGGQVCCSLWGHKELHTTEKLNTSLLISEKVPLLFSFLYYLLIYL